MKLVDWPLMVGCYIWHSEDWTGRGPLCCRLPNVTAHPSTASVPITVLLYSGPLLCGFNVPIKKRWSDYPSILNTHELKWNWYIFYIVKCVVGLASVWSAEAPWVARNRRPPAAMTRRDEVGVSDGSRNTRVIQWRDVRTESRAGR